MNNGNKFTNAITAAVLGVGTYYLSRWALPDSLASIKDTAMIVLTAVAGTIGVWLGNIIYRALGSNS